MIWYKKLVKNIEKIKEENIFMSKNNEYDVFNKKDEAKNKTKENQRNIKKGKGGD